MMADVVVTARTYSPPVAAPGTAFGYNKLPPGTSLGALHDVVWKRFMKNFSE